VAASWDDEEGTITLFDSVHTLRDRGVGKSNEGGLRFRPWIYNPMLDS
jgi:hypothetical protein